MFFSSVLFNSLLVSVFQLLCRLGASFILIFFQFIPIHFWILVFCCSISFSHRHTIAIAHLNNFVMLYWEVNECVCVCVCAHVCMAIKTSPEGVVVVVAASAANNLHQRSKHIESSKTMNTKYSLSLPPRPTTEIAHIRRSKCMLLLLFKCIICYSDSCCCDASLPHLYIVIIWRSIPCGSGYHYFLRFIDFTQLFYLSICVRAKWNDF